jgi:LmbE family N-acetylglucosaminyl deacetylase
MKRLALITFITGWCATGTSAQTAASSAEIYLGLRKLNVLGSVLYVAAHPDDENTRLLTWLSKDGLYRTSYLSVTRGDGGQNLIGNEQGIELGLIRTQELLAARRIDGAEQFFTRAYDFGYSKTPEETFTKWDKEKILADVVWVIRQTQPDVIITRFPTTGEGGHGHHTASAILANEAFTAAADATRFPEQLKWVQPWQAKRILWNTFNFGGTNTQREDQLKIDVGAYNAMLGKSYGEISAESRSQHKSQGFGVPRSRGESFEYLQATGGGQPTSGLFENIQTSWTRVKGSEAIAKLVEQTISTYNFLDPQASVPRLVQLYKTLKGSPQSYWRDVKLKETQTLIEQASGLFLDATTSEQSVAQTDSARINFSVNARSAGSIKLKKTSVISNDSSFNNTLVKNTNFNFTQTVYIPATVPVTQPYWLEEKMSEGYFNVADQNHIGRPDVQPAFTAAFHVTIEGEDFVFTKPVRYKFTDPVKGELYQPFIVLPPVVVNTSPSLVINKTGSLTSSVVTVMAKANKNVTSQAPRVNLQLAQTNIAVKAPAVNLSKAASELYEVIMPPQKSSLQSDAAVPFVQYDASVPANSLALSSIRYDHIPYINYFYTDAVKLLNIDLKTRGKKIGYIVGAGDKVPEALEGMGYEVTLLGAPELGRLSLQSFDAIITGVRAYNTNEWMNAYHDKLMNYVSNGGNLIVQYNTSSNIGQLRAKIGPYPFAISRNRVTNENADVNFLTPAHPVLNFPNLINKSDFDGWVQERSIYDATAFDKKFETILSMADPGERSDSGSLIIARHGKGYFTYTGLVFFRELPAAVPGAYRLLANLIALNQKREM